MKKLINMITKITMLISGIALVTANQSPAWGTQILPGGEIAWIWRNKAFDAESGMFDSPAAFHQAATQLFRENPNLSRIDEMGHSYVTPEGYLACAYYEDYDLLMDAILDERADLEGSFIRLEQAAPMDLQENGLQQQ